MTLRSSAWGNDEAVDESSMKRSSLEQGRALPPIGA